MCYRIVSLRAVSFLLELICTQFHRNVLQNCCVTYNSECISVPAKCKIEESYRIIRISKIRELSISHLCTNQFPLKLFIRNSAKRLYRISFLRIILRGISVPTALFIRSLEIRHPSNPTFAYKLDPFITDYTQVSRDALQNRKIAYNSIPFATDYTQSCEDAPQNHIFAYKVEDISVLTAHFIRSLEIRHPSNPTFAYKLVPFITYYT